MNPWLHPLPGFSIAAEPFNVNAYQQLLTAAAAAATASAWNNQVNESQGYDNSPRQEADRSSQSRGTGNHKNSRHFWEYKNQDEEEKSDKRKDFKDGKIAQFQNDRTSEKNEKQRDRDRDRRPRSKDSRDRRSSSSPKSSDRDSPDRRSRKNRDKREKSNDKDSYDRDGSRSRRDRSPRDRRKRDDSKDRRKRDRSPRSREKEESKHSEGDGRYSLEAVNYKTQTPNETIMIRGLAQHITENDIRNDILQCGMMPKDIRLIRKKETGASRGFAFVEFNRTEEARYWMEMKQGILMFQDQYRALMQFSIVNNESSQANVWVPPTDWDCPKCFTHNFKKRTSCFKCHAPKKDLNDGLECGDEISPHPTTKLILRNLDTLTNEESLLKEISNISSIPIQACQIGRDTLTNISKGVCYLEMKNVLEAIKLFNALTAAGLTVDNRKVNISYCKLNIEKTSHTQSSANPWSSNELHQYKLEDVPRLAEYSAQLYATTPQEKTAYLQYYTQYYTTQIQQGLAIQNPQNPTAGTNAAAAVAQSAIRAAQSKKAGVITAGATPTYMSSKQLIGNTSIGEPDVSLYTYDETSGYFFDARTGLYYDANSQYYYHSQDQTFLYWDAEKHSYMPAPTDSVTAPNTSLNKEENKDDKKKDKEKNQDKVKVAKRIAKDMERWAKTLNQKKEISKSNAVAVQQAQAAAKTASTADIAFAVLERKESAVAAQFDTLGREEIQTNLVASYGGGSDSDEGNEESQEEKHTDWSKMACLLCKRQFPSKEALVRHQQLSDLHKQNLETLTRSRGGESGSTSFGGQYRDRAKERREKFGIPDEPRPNRLKERYLKEREEIAATSFEEPNRTGISSENLGNRMLQKMGWSEGMGLGRSNQGRTDIIEATHRVASAGLGVKSANLGVAGNTGTSYKDNVKRAMMARYQEICD